MRQDNRIFLSRRAQRFLATPTEVERIEPLILCCHYKKIPDTFNSPLIPFSKSEIDKDN